MHSVTILSANYNNAKFLAEYFESILMSEALPESVVFVDDASTDNSLDIVEQYIEQYINRGVNIKLIALERNVGFANALNIGLEHCSTKYIMRLDPDDYISSNRIGLQYNYLINNPNIDAVGSNAIYFRDKIIINKSNFIANEKIIQSRYRSGEHGLLHGTIMIKTELLKQYKYRQENVPAEDYDIFARMVKDGKYFYNLVEPLTYVRIHESSVSNALPFRTVKLTYQLRDKIFQTTTPAIIIFFNYLHMKMYRKYLFENKIFHKYCYLIVSSFVRLDKVYLRIKQFVVKN